MEQVRKATHFCKVCGAQWMLIPPTAPVAPNTWTLISEDCGSCCDNVLMDAQVEEIKD